MNEKQFLYFWCSTFWKKWIMAEKSILIEALNWYFLPRSEISSQIKMKPLPEVLKVNLSQDAPTSSDEDWFIFHTKHAHALSHIHMYTHPPTHTHKHTHIHTCTHTYSFLLLHAHSFTHIHPHTRPHVHTHYYDHFIIPFSPFTSYVSWSVNGINYC